MTQPVLLGGLFIGVLSALPIVNLANCCCLWITGGGVLAARLAQDRQSLPLTPVRGALAGLLAGVVGAFVWLVASAVLNVALGPIQERLIGEMLRDASDVPPEVRQWLELAGDGASASVRLIAGFVLQLMAGGMFSTLGGLIATLFPGSRPRLPVDVPPPMPPR